MYHLQTMGHLALFESRDASEPVAADQKPLLLVAFLALTPGHKARRDHVAELFWPGNGHSTSRRSLRQALYTLSRLLDEPLIVSDNGDLRLSESLTSCDAWDLDEVIAVSDHQRVFELSAQRFLESMARGLGREVQEWIELHNQRLRSKRCEALRALIGAAVAEGRLDEAEWYARAWVLDEPLAEEPRSALVRILKRSGDEAGAYQTYEEYRALLRSAVDDEPSSELAESVEHVRAILIEDAEWRPITDTAEQLLTRRDAKRYVAWAVAASVILVAGAIGTFLFTVGLPLDGDGSAAQPAGPRYGGGEIVIQTAGRFHSLTYDEPAGEWRLHEPEWEVPAPTSSRPPYGPFRLANGELIWTNAVREALDPPFPLVRGEDGWLPTRVTQGDNGWAIPAPDGRNFLVSAQRPGVTPFVKDLYITGLDWIESRAGAEAPRRIVSGTEQIGAYAWSPDGLAIAAVVRGSQDRLTVVRPSGDPVVEVPFYEVLYVAWCGGSDRLAALVNDGERTSVVILEPSSRDVKTIADRALAEALACSPDGRWVAYLAAVDLEPRLHLTEVESGDVEVLPDGDVLTTNSWIHWVPGSVDTGWLDLAIEGPDRLTWGESASLAASLAGQGATALAHEIAWSSSDSWIVSVSSEGTVHANRTGTAEIVASVYGWVADTLRITVDGDRPPALILEDPLETLDETRWIPFGVPSPTPRQTGSGPALWLSGDGRYTDGLLSRHTFSLAAGVRLDFEFSFAPTRSEHGRLNVCLRDPVLGAGAAPPGRVREQACFTYPARELEKFDPGRARLMSAQGVYRDVELAPRPVGEWLRVTVEVRPDGAPALWLEGELVATGAVRLQGTDRSTWRVVLSGSSAEPPLLVRNVALWMGTNVP
ncbi:MAG: BTAD domain-containing putative transcriptional regulator [Gemmatimonadota bacterium]|nr:BTAD domain-containing putative transcriptional regulator [Gemmatimonadota bacterium]